MGCTKSKIQNVYEESSNSSLDNETSEIVSQYEILQRRRRMSYPTHHQFLPPVRRRRSRCQSE